jgi:GDP-mannose 6-dehydrogenase
MAAVTDFADVLVVGNGAAEFRDVLGGLREGQAVIDLVRIAKDQRSQELKTGRYDGICW